LSDKIEKNEMGWPHSTYGVRRDAYRGVVGKPEGRRPLGSHRLRWEDNIKMDLQKVGWVMDWIDLAQNRDGWRTVLIAQVHRTGTYRV